VLAKNLTIADRKRLEVARAMATAPDMLLLDECMAGLRHSEVDETLDVIREIRDSGVTIFMIEHIMRAIMTVSDRITVIQFGRKIMDGTPQEVANDERVVKAYLGESYGAA
jgi:branched-chain amino acid transport system ATP-binding protein